MILNAMIRFQVSGFGCQVSGVRTTMTEGIEVGGRNAEYGRLKTELRMRESKKKLMNIEHPLVMHTALG